MLKLWEKIKEVCYMSITLVTRGKVADIYRIDGNDEISIHNRTNRYSIGDKVFPGEVQYKGIVLTQMSWNWKEILEKEIGMITDRCTQDIKTLFDYGAPSNFAGTAVAVYNCIPIPLECIVRGYYNPESKSWNSYKNTGNMYGNILPTGLKEAEKLPTPIYTPSTKAAPGEHDKNITFEESIDIIKKFIKEKINLSDVDVTAVEFAKQLKKLSLDAYKYAHQYALERGIIIADTKLEFGILCKDDSYTITLIDEVFTPDSSRFWDYNTYEVGKKQPSIDKQYIRRYVYDVLGWDGDSDPPVIPTLVLDQLSMVYLNMYYRLFRVHVEKLAVNLDMEWKAYENI